MIYPKHKLLAAVLVTAVAQPGFAQVRSLYEGMARGAKIPGQYIVTLKQNQGMGSLSQVIQLIPQSAIRFEYHHAVEGFAAKLTDDQVQLLAKHPAVRSIEADSVVRINDLEADETKSREPVTQSNPPSWGLSRVGQKLLPLKNEYTYRRIGEGVNAYVIDTGIHITHEDFENRASAGFSSIEDDTSTDDCHGHGTHVAGTIGGKNYGVAKGVHLFAVRVLDCNGSGSVSGVIAGVDWVKENHKGPSVLNMSLGGGASETLDRAVEATIESGVTAALAAGNSNADACFSSPSRVATAIKAGASTSSDARASFSNIGKCVDLFAPGKDITSAWMTDDKASKRISGTSMASPHVAGVAALYLEINPNAKPAEVKKALLADALVGVVKDVKDSPNLLLQSNLKETVSEPTQPPAPAPVPTAKPVDPVTPVQPAPMI